MLKRYFFVVPVTLFVLAVPAPAPAQIVTGDVGYLTLGRQLLASNDLWGAKDYLEREQVSQPGNPEVKAMLAEVYGKLAIRLLFDKEPTQALSFADKSLAMEPRQVELEYTKGRSHEALKDIDHAIESYESTLALQAGYKDTAVRVVYLYKLRGQDFLTKGDLQSAQRDFVSVRKYAPEDFDANYYLGYIALQVKDFDNARTFLKVSLKEERLENLSQMYLGMVEAETQHWDETVKWMVLARRDETLRVQTDPYLAAAHYNLGVFDLQAKKVDDADRHFQEVLRLDPNHKDALFNLALTWEMKNELDTARDYFKKVRALEPGYRKVEIGLAQVDFKIGVRLFEAKSHEKARTYFLESAQYDASRGEPQYYLALIHRSWKEDEKALPLFETAISRGAFVTESRFQAGEILFLRQEWSKTIAYLDAVVQLSPGYEREKIQVYLREAWWKLALFDIQSKQWVAAEGKLKKVLKYPPDLAATHYYLGFAALKQGHYDTAVAELEPTLKKQPHDIDTKKALAEAHFQLGLASFSAQRYADAHASLLRSFQVDPDNEETQYQLARTRVALTRFSEAIPVLEKLAKREPPFRDSQDDLAKAYGGLGEQLLDKNNKPQARIYFEKALKINPNEMSALYGTGAIAISEKRYDEASRNLQAVHDRDQDYRRSYPMLLDAYWNLGLRAYDKKEPLAASGYFQKVIDLDPNHGEALYYMGDLEVNAKNYDVAKNYFERAINRQTRLVESHYGLGTVLYEQQMYGDAADHFETTSKLNPTYKNVDSYLRRAIYNQADRLFREGNSTESVVYYIRYFALEPKNPDIALRIADISEKAGFGEQAMEWYDKAIPLMKSDPDPVRFKLAMLAFKSKQYSRALQVAGRIKSADARDLKGSIYIAMGKRDRAAGDLKEAMVNFKMALLIAPDNADLLFEYGQVRLSMNDYVEAAVYLRRAVDKNPALPKGKEMVAEVFRKLGAEAFAKERLDEADRNFKISLLYGPAMEAEYHIAVIAFLKKDFEKALPLFQKVEKENPRYLANANYLKDTVCKLGGDALAKNDFQRARELITICSKYNPSDRTLRYQLAILAFKQQEFEEARQRFRDIVLNSPGAFPEAEGYLVDSLFALENTAFEQGDFEKAQKFADEVIERSPTSFRAHFARGRSLEQRGDLDEAEKEIRLVLGTRPGMEEAVTALKRIQAAKETKAAAAKPAPVQPQ